MWIDNRGASRFAMGQLGAARLLALVLTLGLVGSCENSITVPMLDGGTSPVPGLKSLAVTPQSVTLTTGPGATQQQQFTAVGTYDDGHTEDVTKSINWSAVSTGVADVGQISSKGLFSTGAYGGTATIYAISGTLTAMATLMVRLTQVVQDPSAGTGGAGSFGGPVDTQPAPAIVYPYNGVVMPPNLGFLEIQWTKGNAAHTLFEVSLQNTNTNLTIYTGCTAVGAGCSFSLPAPLWDAVAQTNAGATSPTVITVRGTGPSKVVGTSKPIQMSFTAQALHGGIYYWSTEDTRTGTIYRIDLALGTVSPYYTTAMSPLDHTGTRTCVGCHAISNDGNRLSMVLGGGDVSDLLQIDVASVKQTLLKNTVATGFSNFQSYGRDGSSFVSSLAGNLKLVDSTSGNNLIASIFATGTGAHYTHPSWSHSGKYLAFTKFSDDLNSLNNGSYPITPQEFEQFESRGAVGISTWDGKAFGAPQILVAEKSLQNSYYPAVGPDDATVVFNQVSGCATEAACWAYDNAKAKIYMTTVTPGGGQRELTNLNTPGPTDVLKNGAQHVNLTNSWPKFSPFIQNGAQKQTILWVTFSSKRAYGLEVANNDPTLNGAEEAVNKPQLWMAAITVGTEATGDPSSPPFWIPRQNKATGNHIAQWTEQIVPILP